MNIEHYIHPDENEKPLEQLDPTGGMTAIFRRVGCIGDSLSSGELEVLNESGNKVWLDLYEHSWGQYLARMTGATVYNFSKGGMTAIEYLATFGDFKNFFDPKLACDAYIVALGVNDLFGRNQQVGSLEDLDRNDPKQSKETFAGYLGRLILRYKEIQPNAKFFYLTMPREQNETDEKAALRDAHAKLMYDFAEGLGNGYVIDLRQYGPVYDIAFKEKFYGGGHLNSMGYYFTALEVASYIDYIIRHDPRAFRSTGLAGLPYTLC